MMEKWSADEEAEAQYVYPARDAERSIHVFNERERMTSKAELPIGVFDSGVGGLTILSALRKELPFEQFVYFADTAYCPYGVRSDADITTLSVNACRFLLEQHQVKLLVVACNTASQAALNTLRATFHVPFVGVVPAVKPAARLSRRGRIGVMATNNAVKAAYLRQLIDDFADGLEVYAVGCPELVTLVEHGELSGPIVEEAVRHALQPLLAQGVDIIVLGCTHFPALRSVIEQVAGKGVQVIDSGAAIARRTHAILDAEDLKYTPAEHQLAQREPLFYCSGDAADCSDVASKVLGYAIVAEQVTF